MCLTGAVRKVSWSWDFFVAKDEDKWRQRKAMKWREGEKAKTLLTHYRTLWQAFSNDILFSFEWWGSRWIVCLNEQSIQGASCLANGKMKYYTILYWNWNCCENEIDSFLIVRVTSQRKKTYSSFRTCIGLIPKSRKARIGLSLIRCLD